MTNTSDKPFNPGQGDLSKLEELRSQLDMTLDAARPEAVGKRHAKGYRSARENLADLVDEGSFIEYGQLAVAAQRARRSLEDLRSNTPADGVITGLATINAAQFGEDKAAAAVIVNDYSVLAGTQGFFHHRKLDRIVQVALERQLPVVMYTEGGGGRPGDTDIQIGGGTLDVSSFVEWARLCNSLPTIAVNNGYCFAGNAALFGCADIRIATRDSWIGMAGPAMIEGGGLGQFSPQEIGPMEVQGRNAVVDLVADDEAAATALAKQLLAYTQGDVADWACADQDALRTVMPADRRYAYDVRGIIATVADAGSFIELTRAYGGAVITAFIRIEGRAMGLLANDCRVLGGAVDCDAAKKAGRFIALCDKLGLPLLSLCDTPGFMVGPNSEAQGAALHMASLFRAGAALQIPIVTVILRKAYGLGAMAMAGGSLKVPVLTAAWPTGETGPMGLEGAVTLGFRKELEAVADATEREALFNQLVDDMYQRGKATESAAATEIDAVIDPAETRKVVLRALA
ncbi:biotin carboxylase [Seongchinamella sediminis]|uniref:Biotin carboxylase n=1 Tax=Seongchinamella sediminis TaxID=2283635 RepID=A0A3L7DYG4_9GAMM|nr:carboxyl transferase domain-containing protein [Seongchinamella sediminis]RLQ22648.1 biotin carboxylase [Seongchinamella sediminis]